jgi:hypothetical protein
MKKFLCLIFVSVFMILGVGLAMATDAPLPKADLEGRGQLVSLESVQRGEMDLSKDIYALHDRLDRKDTDWRPSERTKMSFVEVNGQKFLLAHDIFAGMCFHPYQPGVGFLKINFAHPKAFMEGDPALDTSNGRTCYMGQ